MRNAEPLQCGVRNAECGSGLRSAERSADHASRITHHVSRFTRRGFSLVEILVTIALLSFIVLGLFAMFNQTQRAFMTSMGQTDVLEGRSHGHGYDDPRTGTAHAFGRSGHELSTRRIDTSPRAAAPESALRAVRRSLRTNYLQDIFMLTRQNQNWVGIGYCVRVSDPTWQHFTRRR